MNRTSVMLLFGGESSEHTVSISSARNVYAAIDDSKFDVLLGYIDKHGKWWLLDNFSTEINTHGASQLAPVFGSESFLTFPNNSVIKPDVILPILHGKNGEDGSVQGLAQLLHIPIVGCDMTSSAICMDKVATKEILEARGIVVSPYEVHRVGKPIPDFNHLSMRLGSPMFVKPSHAGSSVGVSKVYSEEEFIQAIAIAHEHDDSVLIERGITGRELEVAVLGNPPTHETSTVGEVKPSEDFYSYEAKYAATSTSEVIIPADLDEAVRSRIRTIAGDVYAALGCRGLSRVDFFLADDGTVYVNEINTIPGFTNISMYPKLWREAGVSYSQLIERLILLALEDTTIKVETIPSIN
ncbi:MAG: ddl, D-alanyl-alanine synthetase D-alanine-D-alanine ligase [Candidatus Saccharibacteria bacterium]|nr:ddl, D-alanyl-alanine synthetase D-alanine-D-alanine ligase [Candidatus Saccharibacteria bacterium]